MSFIETSYIILRGRDYHQTVRRENSFFFQRTLSARLPGRTAWTGRGIPRLSQSPRRRPRLQNPEASRQPNGHNHAISFGKEHNGDADASADNPGAFIRRRRRDAPPPERPEHMAAPAAGKPERTTAGSRKTAEAWI
jgi:hypothetical protein